VKTQFRRKPRADKVTVGGTTKRRWFSVAAPLSRDGSEFSQDVRDARHNIFVRRGFGQK